MEIFIGIRNDLLHMGVIRIDHPHSKIINICHHFLIFIVIFSFSLAALWFFIFDAETLNEHINSFTPVLIGLFTFSTNCSLLLQRAKLLDLIKEFELIIGSRKLRANNTFHNFSHFEAYLFQFESPIR